MTLPHKRVIYALFSLTLLLLLVMAACDLLASTRMLPGSVVPEPLSLVATTLRDVGLLLGLLAGGIYIALNSDPRPPT
ncbi:MAG: hypothetical protein KC615_23285, partial [Anaerolineae bacterium]|nr:hypothetical protein [Anaerolineae bacterium]